MSTKPNIVLCVARRFLFPAERQRVGAEIDPRVDGRDTFTDCRYRHSHLAPKETPPEKYKRRQRGGVEN